MSKMKKQQILLSVIVLLHTAFTLPNLQSEWKQWKKQYGKIYDNKYEEKIHYDIWKENREYIMNHNAKEGQEFILELNQFADENFNQASLDLPKPDGKNVIKEKSDLTFVPESRSAPAIWDWRKKGAIGPVKNQGQMGDVQSITAEECVESYWFINKGQLVTVSLIEIHDCCVKQRFVTKDMFGCIHNIGGLCSDADYPQTPGQCRNNTCTPVVQINGDMRVPVGNETAMMNAVYTMPTMAMIDAGQASFQFYKSGIYSDPSCQSTKLDHAVQVVGYGTMNGKDYWICKNSWGVNWGDKGYILIARNKGNMCGIASYASYPV